MPRPACTARPTSSACSIETERRGGQGLPHSFQSFSATMTTASLCVRREADDLAPCFHRVSSHLLGTPWRTPRCDPDPVFRREWWMTDNPFFEAWSTPFGFPPFDRIRPEHFPPAFDRGMAEEAAEFAAVARSGEGPSFANTVEAMERSGRALRRATDV